MHNNGGSCKFTICTFELMWYGKLRYLYTAGPNADLGKPWHPVDNTKTSFSALNQMSSPYSPASRTPASCVPVSRVSQAGVCCVACLPSLYFFGVSDSRKRQNTNLGVTKFSGWPISGSYLAGFSVFDANQMFRFVCL